MKSASRKAKGQKLQKWCCEWVSKLTGVPWGKDKLISTRPSGQSGVDVVLIGEALEKFPFSIECKNQETWAVPFWVKQAKVNQREGTDWMLVVSKNRHKPIIILDAEAFFRIYQNFKKPFIVKCESK